VNDKYCPLCGAEIESEFENGFCHCTECGSEFSENPDDASSIESLLDAEKWLNSVGYTLKKSESKHVDKSQKVYAGALRFLEANKNPDV
jgi:tRNA(Ile2) C34 agmatinyltransferase TiaS